MEDYMKTISIVATIATILLVAILYLSNPYIGCEEVSGVGPSFKTAYRCGDTTTYIPR